MCSIPFTKESVKDYLDRTIRYKRNCKNNVEISLYEKQIIAYYVDAFQTVRLALFGATLPEGD